MGILFHCTYFRSGSESRIYKENLTWLINLTSREAKSLSNISFMIDRNMALQMLWDFWRSNDNPHKLLASYRKEIKQMTNIKSGDAAAHRRLFNFLIKCQSLEYDKSIRYTRCHLYLGKNTRELLRQMEKKCAKDRRGPDERIRVSWPDKFHWG